MKKKICLFIPYFGKLPNYFPLWLKSVAYNRNINFFIVTDINMGKYNIPDNVFIKNQSFDDFKNTIQKLFNFEICLDSPYKLVDFKPAYGYIFQNEIQKFGADYWGYCDVDIIFGNIEKYLNKISFYEIDYEKVGQHGHFMVYKNTDRMKMLFSQGKKVDSALDYKKVFSQKYIFHFDETAGIDIISHHFNIYEKSLYGNLELISEKRDKILESFYFSDVLPYYSNFISEKNEIIDSSWQYFEWEKGCLKQKYCFENGEYFERESMYAHLQKRSMEYNLNINEDLFLIFPNQITNDKRSIIDTKKNYEKFTEHSIIDWRVKVIYRLVPSIFLNKKQKFNKGFFRMIDKWDKEIDLESRK